MSKVDSYSTNKTSFEFQWPANISGLERIMSAARGDLQRLMSTFFARPISITLVWSNTEPRLQPASVETPIKQTRQVKLVCEGRTVCIPTSTVTITNPTAERLFLDEKYAIGQCYRKLNREVQFSLIELVTGKSKEGKDMLRRRYTLSAGGLHCDIVEVFPDREMFIRGTEWLYDPKAFSDSDSEDIEDVDVGVPRAPTTSAITVDQGLQSLSLGSS